MKRWQKIAAASVGGLLAAVLGLGWYTGLLTDNLREVSGGKLYRSAQLDIPSLRHAIESRKIKCVLNLRGQAANDAWYLDELRVCRELNVAHVDVRMVATRLPRAEEVRQLIEALEKGPYPMLLHCAQGADRSGLASAVYLILVEKKSVKEAIDAQLTWRYGHVPLGGTQAMDRFFELYLEQSGGRDFKSWALEDYPKIVGK